MLVYTVSQLNWGPVRRFFAICEFRGAQEFFFAIKGTPWKCQKITKTKFSLNKGW